MTLRQKQSVFAELVGKLILHAYKDGYEITLGNAFRSPEECQRLADAGKGIKNSLHGLKLAIDLNLFKDGKYLSGTMDHLPLGIWWEKQSTDLYECCWGGRFGDGNHYSLKHGNRK